MSDSNTPDRQSEEPIAGPGPSSTSQALSPDVPLSAESEKQSPLPDSRSATSSELSEIASEAPTSELAVVNDPILSNIQDAVPSVVNPQRSTQPGDVQASPTASAEASRDQTDNSVPDGHSPDLERAQPRDAVEPVLDDVAETNEQAHELPGTFSQYWPKFLTFFAMIAFLTWGIISVLAFSILPVHLYGYIPFSGPSGSQVLLRAVTEAVGELFRIYSDETLQAIFWARISSAEGITMASLLSISPATGLFGLWELARWPRKQGVAGNATEPPSKGRQYLDRLVAKPLLRILAVLFFPIYALYSLLTMFTSRRSSSGDPTHPREFSSYHRMWIIVRLLLLISIPFINIVVFAENSTQTTYQSRAQKLVGAGIGDFQPASSSYSAAGYFQFSLSSLLPAFFTTYSAVLSEPPVNSTACSKTSNCASYFFSGGLQVSSPNPSFYSAVAPEADAIILEHEAGLQFDYWNVDPGADSLPFNANSQCQTWILPSDQESGFMICLRQSTVNSNYIVAGMSLCPNEDGNCGLNDTWRTTTPLLTTMALYARNATTTYSRSTYQLLEADNFSSPRLQTISGEALFFVMDSFFSNPPLNTSEVVDPAIYDFISWTNNYFYDYLAINNGSGILAATDLFRALLTVPFLWFQPNGFAPNVTVGFPSTIKYGLPASLTVTANLAQGKSHISLAPWTAYTYIAVSSVLFFFLTGAVALSIRSPTVNTSNFSLLDFSSHVLAGGIGTNSLGRKLLPLAVFESRKDIKESLKYTRVFLRGLDVSTMEGGEVIETPGFTINENENEYKGMRLRKHEKIYIGGSMYTTDRKRGAATVPELLPNGTSHAR